MARIRQYPPEKDSVRAREERKGQALTERKVKNRDELDAKVRRYVGETGKKIKTFISEMPTSYVMRELDRIKEKGRTGPTVTEDPQPLTPGTEGDWRKGKRDSDIRDRYDSMAEDIAAGNSSISDIKDAFDKRQVRKRLRSIASDVDIDTRSRRR
jgi:hypothetical protein